MQENRIKNINNSKFTEIFYMDEKLPIKNEKLNILLQKI